MSAFAQTVTGRLPANALGAVLMHEHILCDLRSPATRDKPSDDPPIILANRFEVDYFQNRNQSNMLLDEDAVAADELSRFKQAGGGTIVELTVGGLRPQPRRLRQLAGETGVAIVMGAGYYTDTYMPETVRGADVDALDALIEAQLRTGAWDTDIRAGLIGEIGCSWPLADSERRMLVAAARVQARAGVAITIHPGRHEDAPAEIADILLMAGADPGRTVIGHMDRTVFDRERLFSLLRRGFVLEWDFFGIETSHYWMPGDGLDLPTDYMRLDLIFDLMTSGYRDQIAVSHDICTKTRLAAYGGHGYLHLVAHVIPMMRRRGWPDDFIERLFVHTPARLLCYLSGSEPGSRERGAP